MNKHLVSVSAAFAIAAMGGLAYAQSDSTAQAANNNGAPGVEVNVGANAKNDGGLPGVETNVGADGDQKNLNTAPDTNTLGAGAATDATTDTSNSANDLTQPKADRN